MESDENLCPVVSGGAIASLFTLGTGCLGGAAIGYTVVSIVGGVSGFYAGGYSQEVSDAMNGLPDDYNLPRPK